MQDESLPKFSLEKFVKADIETIFDIAVDLDGLQKAMPDRFPFVRTLSTRDNVSVVEERMIIAGKNLVMMTKHIVDRPRMHEIFVIGGDSKGSHITERFSVDGPGTKITVSADLKLNGALMVTGFFGRGKIKEDFASIIDEFAKLAKG